MRKKSRFNIISAVLAVAILCVGFYTCDMDTLAADMASVTVKVSMKHEGGTVAVTGMENRTIPAGKTEDYVFTCTEPGTSVYEVKQISTVPGAVMDTIVYDLTVYAQYETDAQTGTSHLTASAYVQEQGKTEKKAELSFDNIIPKEDIPDTPKDPEVPKEPESPDNGTPVPNTGKTAQTGDPNSAGAWMSLLSLAMLGFVVIFYCRKGKEGRKMQ